HPRADRSARGHRLARDRGAACRSAWLRRSALDGLVFPRPARAHLQKRRHTTLGKSTKTSHKVKGIREAIGGAGAALIYLPHNSPVLNPIEKAFSKVKAIPISL